MSKVTMIGCDLHDRSLLLRYSIGDAKPEQGSFANDSSGRQKMVDWLWQFAQQHDKQIKGMSPPARRKLLTFDWPGNVRQLRNVVESMVVVDYDGLLDLDDLPEELAGPAESTGEPSGTSLAGLVGKPLEELERLFITETLRATGGNREDAAAMLGIGERTLYRKIKGYGL